MGRLKVLSAREVCRILSENGFVEVRRRGSHIAMQRKSGESTRTAIVPDHATIKIGTLLSIIRQSGLPRALFESSSS